MTLEKRLEGCGIRSKPNTTGVWEGAGVDAEEAAKEFQKVFEILAGSPGLARGQLNHLWIYIDRAVEKQVTPTIPLVFKTQSSGNSRIVFRTTSFSVMRKLCCLGNPNASVSAG